MNDSETVEGRANEEVLDVRVIPKPDRHPLIVAAFNSLPVGGSLVLTNDHDPRHLHEEFETDRPGSFDWDYLNRQRGDYRIRITKLTSTTLPRLLVNTNDLTSPPETSGDGSVARGAVWALPVRDRDLDSNVIALPPGETIDSHVGADLGVVIHVLSGSGRLEGERNQIDLVPGALIWLPPRSQRSFVAGPDGLRYFTVHRRRQSLVIDTSLHHRNT